MDTLEEFIKNSPSEDEFLRKLLASELTGGRICPSCKRDSKFYKLEKRKAFSCMYCGHHIYPLVPTIFHKSSTPLQKWRYGIYLLRFYRRETGKVLTNIVFSDLLGVTYKTGYRMKRTLTLVFENRKEVSPGIFRYDFSKSARRV